jgi:phytoene synthase
MIAKSIWAIESGVGRDVRPERRSTTRVSALLGSSQYRALSDDALKDEDNAAWVLSLPEDARRAWLSRIHWIRLVDRLAENERFEPDERRFTRFLEAWRLLRAQGVVDPAGPFAHVLSGIRTTWLLTDTDAVALRSIAAWDAYLEALADYHGPEVTLRTLREHDEMLWRLSGRIFQLVPYLTLSAWDAAGEFGRLDQFFNNVRDLLEDAEHGVCYLPADILDRFGVSRHEMLSGSCIARPEYKAMMRFWFDEHLPLLRARAFGFVEITDLHPSLAIMKTWSMHRHDRIERVMRALDFDFRRFPGRYWAEVRRDLAAHRAAARRRPPGDMPPHPA